MRNTVLWTRVFRFLTVATGTVALLGLSFEEGTASFLEAGGILLAVCFGWMFAGLCSDIRWIREKLDSIQFEYTFQEVPVRSSAGDREGEAFVQTPFESFSVRKLGDRVFKADETRTCTSCQQYDEEEIRCEVDGESLKGITVAAVGCQHWVPGLKVTESNQGGTVEPPETDPDGEP